MKSIIALDATNNIPMDDGTKVSSKVIYIRPGQAALLSLSGMQQDFQLSTDKKMLTSNSCIEIKRVFMGEAELKAIEKECGTNQSHTSIADNLIRQQKVEPHGVYQCGEPWNISPCSNIKLIDVPGFYVAELSDISQLEELRLEYSILTLAQAASIQSDIRLGA